MRVEIDRIARDIEIVQKTCYRLAAEQGADIVIVVHPDYQYTSKLLPAMAALIGNDLYHCVLGSRILGGYALQGGMPAWRYVSNRLLTLAENLFTGAKLSEYHTGYRAFSRALLERLPITGIRTTSSSIIGCFFRSCGLGTQLQRSAVRPGISQRRQA